MKKLKTHHLHPLLRDLLLPPQEHLAQLLEAKIKKNVILPFQFEDRDKDVKPS